MERSDYPRICFHKGLWRVKGKGEVDPGCCQADSCLGPSSCGARSGKSVVSGRPREHRRPLGRTAIGRRARQPTYRKRGRSSQVRVFRGPVKCHANPSVPSEVFLTVYMKGRLPWKLTFDIPLTPPNITGSSPSGLFYLCFLSSVLYYTSSHQNGWLRHARVDTGSHYPVHDYRRSRL
jgi:hypothetical protein